MSPLEIMGTVLTFLYSVLAQFPIQPVAPVSDTRQSASSDSNISMARQTASKFSSVYDALLSEMTSQQRQPDYKRAEQTRESMSSYARGVTQQYGDFADKMTDMFERLTGEYRNQAPPAPKQAP